MGFRQCLTLSIVQLKSKHCQKTHYRNGAVDKFGHNLLQIKIHNERGSAPGDLQLTLQQWGAGNVYPLVLSKARR